MLQEVGTDDLPVDKDRTVLFDGHHAEDEERALQQPIERYEASDNTREELDAREHGKHHPIRQPFRVIQLIGRFDGFDRNVGRIGNSDHVAKELGRITKSQI